MIEIPKNWADLPEDERFLFYSYMGWALSNFAAVIVDYDGRIWLTAEHAYQAAKFKGGSYDSNKQRVYDKIYRAPDPLAAKQIAYSWAYTEFVRPDWEYVKLQVMLDIKRAQVAGSVNLMNAIIKFSKFGKVWLVEDSSKDAYWGRGKDWCGLNNLGIVYMIIMEEHLNDGYSELREQLGLI